MPYKIYVMIYAGEWSLVESEATEVDSYRRCSYIVHSRGIDENDIQIRLDGKVIA